MEAVKEKYSIVMWTQEKHPGGKVTWALVDTENYMAVRTAYLPISVKADKEDLAFLKLQMNRAYDEGQKDASSITQERTIQFDESTWNMLQKIIEGGKKALEKHPLAKLIESLGENNPGLQKVIQEAKVETMEKRMTPEGFLKDFIKDQYVEGVKRGLVKP